MGDKDYTPIIAEKIKNCIGKCDDLTIDDAVEFFVKQYGAREIDPKYIWNYTTTKSLSPEALQLRLESGYPLDPATVPESELYANDFKGGVMDIDFEYPEEYARAILFDKGCLRRVEPEFDAFWEHAEKHLDGIQFLEYEVLAFSTPDGKSIRAFDHGGHSAKLYMEAYYFCLHSTLSIHPEDEDIREWLIKTVKLGNYSCFDNPNNREQMEDVLAFLKNIRKASAHNKQYIADKIKNCIGKCDDFTIDDAVNFFVKQYGAREIDPKLVRSYGALKKLSPEALNWRLDNGYPLDPAALPENNFNTDDNKEKWIIKEIPPNTTVHSLLFDADCMRRVEPVVQAIENRYKLQRDGIRYFRYELVTFSTVDGVSINNFHFEGLSSKLDCEIHYLFAHGVKSNDVATEETRDNLLLHEGYSDYFAYDDLAEREKQV